MAKWLVPDIWGWFNDIMVINLSISWGFLMEIDHGWDSMLKNNGYTPIWDVFSTTPFSWLMGWFMALGLPHYLNLLESIMN